MLLLYYTERIVTKDLQIKEMWRAKSSKKCEKIISYVYPENPG